MGRFRVIRISGPVLLLTVEELIAIRREQG